MLVAGVIDGLPLAVVLAAFYVGAAASPVKLVALLIGWLAWNRAWSLVHAHDARVRAALHWRCRHRRALAVVQVAALAVIVAVQGGVLGTSEPSASVPAGSAESHSETSVPAGTGRVDVIPTSAATEPHDPDAPLPFVVTGVATGDVQRAPDGALVAPEGSAGSDAPVPFAVTGTHAR